MIKSFPQQKASYFAMEGGLDLVTPAISMPAGRVTDSMNYEPETAGGYRRVDGYERFSGLPSPSDTATYMILEAALTSDPPIGYGINGTLSGVGGRLVKKIPMGDKHILILVQYETTPDHYIKNEPITLEIDFVQTTIGVTLEASYISSSPEIDADYMLLAANERRNDIEPIAGSGPIRGVTVMNDIVYAFRDDVAGLTGKIWKSSDTGWTEVTLGKELKFREGEVEIKDGDVISNGTGGTATVIKVARRAGVWSNTGSQAVGHLFLSNVVGTFVAGETLYVAAVARAIADSSVTNISRAAGGTMEMIRHNFGGANLIEYTYGVDGVNPAFFFDGTNYFPIRTGLPDDRPQHVAAHLNYLFMSYFGNMQWSGVGNPFSWDALDGAGAINAGQSIAGFMPMTGDAQGGAMGVFSQTRAYILYGKLPAQFSLQTVVQDIGYTAGTIQAISGTAFGLTARGLQTLSATQAYGDFAFASISAQVQPLITRLRGKETCSTVLKNRNQYRVFYNDGSCLVVGLTNEKVTAIMPLDYTIPVRCVHTATFSDGRERTFFGSDDGYVYEDFRGTSFDGDAIESWVRLNFNHASTPSMRKRWRRVVLEGKVLGYCKLNFTYDLGYGNPEVTPPPSTEDINMIGGAGGYWDQFTWDQFFWDSAAVNAPSLTIEGTEKNISMVFYSNRAQDYAHTIQGITMIYTERRTER